MLLAKKIVVILLILALLGGTVVSILMVANSGTKKDPFSDLPLPVIRSLKFSDFRGADLSSRDFSGQADLIPTFSFNSATKWPGTDKMPSGQVPEKILEKAKYPGLGLSELHKKGLTGQGVSIGMIGKPIRQDHKEYKENVTYIPVTYQGTSQGAGSSLGSETKTYDFESTAMTGLLVGKNGVAPKAHLYYFAMDSKELTENPYQEYMAALNKVIDIKEKLGREDKIKLLVVPFLPDQYGDPAKYQEFMDGLEKLKDQGTLVLYPGMPGISLQGAGSLPGKDRDDPKSYVSWSWDQAKAWVLGRVRERKVTNWEDFRKEMARLLTEDKELNPLLAEAIHTYVYIMALYRDSIPFSQWIEAASDTKPKEDTLSVPCDYLTVPDPSGDDAYAYLGAGPLTLWFPYTAGVISLGLETLPSATQEEVFASLLKSCTQKDGLRLINPLGFIESLTK